ncbi:hypothetical protein ACGFXC_01800 [Streptomyces sp. NPDC048507]|uniref:hypothetical protein n=1 Tax=Streptomyces sp. NPDC048507 TaxID=3365560 RepID=UPI0037162FF3
MPSGTVNEALAALGPVRDRAGHSLPVEPRLLQKAPAPWRDVRVLLTGGLRARGGADATQLHQGPLLAGAQRAYLGDRREFLDPLWMEALVREYGDRPVRDLASRLADDMLAQSRRVALRKLRYDPRTGGLKIFSRLHMRNDRYFRIGEEPKAEIGLRIPQLGSIGRQLGLFEAGSDGSGPLTPTRAALKSLEVAV